MTDTTDTKDDIKTRLQEGTVACLKSYESWNEDRKNVETRENLQETIHELRKITSRLEIEIAISERQEMTNKPLPIPPHRSSFKSKGVVESILPDHGNTVGNSGAAKKDGGSRRPRSRRPAPKK